MELSRFASDYCGPSANFLDKLNSPVIPGTSGFYGNWVKDVRAGQFVVFGNFCWQLPGSPLLIYYDNNNNNNNNTKFI